MISFGTRVSIFPCSEYGNRFANWTGVACKWHRESGKIGIKFDNLKNPDSREGVFWFHEDHLAIIHDTTLARESIAPLWWMRSPNPSLYHSNPISIKRVIFSGTKTIVLWGDGDKTIVSCGVGDQFDPYAGFCAAVTKKVFGSTSAAKKTLEPFVQPHESNVNPLLPGLAEVTNSLNKAMRAISFRKGNVDGMHFVPGSRSYPIQSLLPEG